MNRLFRKKSSSAAADGSSPARAESQAQTIERTAQSVRSPLQAPTNTQSLRDTDSIAPLIKNDGPPTQHASDTKRRSSASHFFKRPERGPKRRKASFSDSGPYIFTFDPATGKERLMKNPHWPHEDSWKTEKTGFQGTTAGMIIPAGKKMVVSGGAGNEVWVENTCGV